MNVVTPKDLFDFKFVSDFKLSPNGEHGFFLLSMPNEKDNEYKKELWILNTSDNSHSLLIQAGKHGGYTWIDNETILFTASDYAPSKANTTHFYTIKISDGKVEEFCTIPYKVSSFNYMGDGKFVCNISHTCSEESKLTGGNVSVFDELYFWYDGKGVCNKRRNGLVIYDSRNQSEKKITDTYFNLAEFAVSPNKENIVYSGREYKDVNGKANTVYCYNLSTETTEFLTPMNINFYSNLIFWDNNRIFYGKNDLEYSGKHDKYCLYSFAEGEIPLKKMPDCSLGSTAGSDVAYGGGITKKMLNGKLYITRVHWSKGVLTAVEETGKIEDIIATDGGVMSFDMVGDKLYTVSMRGNKLKEIYSFDLKSGEETQITHFNDSYADNHFTPTPQVVNMSCKNGTELEGYIIYPVGYESGKKYPAVLQVHGGPKSIYSSIFGHEMQSLAANGYFVFYTNPPGSNGRDSAFAKITGNLGKADVEAVLDFTDYVITNFPDIDEKRVGICGGSYGGFVTNRLITNTNQFKAACSQRSISNYITKSLTGDIGYYHNISQLGTTQWEDFNTFWEASPLKYAKNCTTPTLFIHSDKDYRCFIGESVQMYNALKRNSVATELVVFEGENHELARTGKPQSRVRRLSEIAKWFKKYL